MRSIVTRLLVGGFLAPESVAPGERVVVNAWLVRHPEATVLIDTGFGEHLPETMSETLRIIRTPITDALSGIGVEPSEVDLVINCHLHADHAGGNVHFRGTRILVQPDELAAARGADYTVPEDIDLDGGHWDERSGEARAAARHPHHSHARALAGTPGRLDRDRCRPAPARRPDVSAGIRLRASRYRPAAGPRGLPRPTLLSGVAAAPA